MTTWANNSSKAPLELPLVFGIDLGRPAHKVLFGAQVFYFRRISIVIVFILVKQAKRCVGIMIVQTRIEQGSILGANGQRFFIFNRIQKDGTVP